MRPRTQNLVLLAVGTFLLWLLSLPWKLVENAVIGWISTQIEKHFGIVSPTTQDIVSFLVSWGPPAIGAAVCVAIAYQLGTYRKPSPASGPDTKEKGIDAAREQFQAELRQKAAENRAALFGKPKVDRIPLTEMLRIVIASPKEIDMLKFFADIRQAGVDEEIRFWGRLQRHSIDFLNDKEPLLQIPKEHWVQYQISPLDVFTFDNKGNNTGVQADNKKAFTYQPGHGTGPGCYIDLHAHRQDVEAFLKRHGF